ncbi:MAG: hypothetical protein NZM28_00395 [Fimbriimonadales bacterium]|nr:hypothetical protein [Fimbriimonadales bacterium]
MKSRTTRRFRKALENLPSEVQRQAKEAYRLFRQNPFHPSLHFKRVHPTEPLYSVRITHSYRAIGLWEGDAIEWIWIGAHDEYERLLQQ